MPVKPLPDFDDELSKTPVASEAVIPPGDLNNWIQKWGLKGPRGVNCKNHRQTEGVVQKRRHERGGSKVKRFLHKTHFQTEILKPHEELEH